MLEFDLPETFLRHSRGTELSIPGKSFTAGGVSSVAFELPEREEFPSRWLGLPLAAFLAAACVSSAPTPTETPNTPNTPTATAEAKTPTPSATFTPEPSPTKEILRFPLGGVFSAPLTENNIINGGFVLVPRLDDSRILYAYFSKGKSSSAGIIFSVDPNYRGQLDNFTWSGPEVALSGKMINTATTTGKIKVAVPKPGGGVNVVLDADYAAVYRGTGQDSFVEQVRVAYQIAGGGMVSSEQMKRLLEQMLRTQLPEF